MKQMLTQQYAQELLDYDAETGLFRWKQDQRSNRARAGDIAGSPNQMGYIRIGVRGRKIYAHRLAVLWMTGETPKCVDHINGDRSDNRWSNLRSASGRLNQGNRHRMDTRNKTGFRGVYLDPRFGKYQAMIRKAGKGHWLGQYDTPEEAYEAYKLAARQHFGEFYNDLTAKE